MEKTSINSLAILFFWVLDTVLLLLTNMSSMVKRTPTRPGKDKKLKNSVAKALCFSFSSASVNGVKVYE